MAIIIECDNCGKQIRYTQSGDRPRVDFQRPPSYDYNNGSWEPRAFCKECDDAGNAARIAAIEARKK